MSRTHHGTRVSVCPQCRRLLPGDCVETTEGLLLEKLCPAHGRTSTRLAQDYAWLAGRQEFAARSFTPLSRQTGVREGCPWDCGECPEHRQHSAFFLFEITNACDLHCPICLGDPQERGFFLSPSQVEGMADAVLAYAGPGQIITLGGGEPLVHPQFLDLVRAIKGKGFSEIWVYTNGRRVARDADFAQGLADEGLCLVLQWDGFSDRVYELLRGRPLLEEKQEALARLKAAGARLGLCATVAAGVNDGELGRLYDLFLEDADLGLLDLAVMAYVGKGAQTDLGREPRLTSQDVLLSLEEQTGGRVRESDFSPVSFAHPECLQIAYHLAEPDGGFVPLKRFLHPDDYRALIADKPLLSLSAEAEETFRAATDRVWAGNAEDPLRARGLAAMRHLIATLFPRAGALSPEERQARAAGLAKVVLVHSYMDGLNFDVGRSRLCISRTVLPDGRLMPTCAYNVLHRQTG